MTARTALVSAAVFLTFAAGCGGDDDAEDGRPAARELVSAFPERPTDAARDAVRQRGSSARAVLDLWRVMKSGAVPVAVLAYDTDLRRSVGVSSLATVLAALQGTVEPYEPRIIDVEATDVGSLVLVRAVEKNGPPVEYAYVLRRRRGQWLVTYDTLVGRNIEALVTREQATLDGNVAEPSRRAQREGAATARRFRQAGLASDGS